MDKNVIEYINEASKIETTAILDNFMKQGDIYLIAIVRLTIAEEIAKEVYTNAELQTIAKVDNTLKELFTPTLLEHLDSQFHRALEWWS